MNDPNYIRVAGHRGYRKAFPENTLLSFQKALEIGVDMIEFDLHLSKDGHLVIIHDDLLDRTTNGSGPVKDLTLSELQSLDAGSWMGPEFKGLTIPTLDELLETVHSQPDLLFNVEIKSKTHETVDKTIHTLKHFNVIDRCVIACFDARILHYVHDHWGLRCQGFPETHLQNYSDGPEGTFSKLYSVGIEKSILTPERVKHFQALNILPWGYVIDTTSDAQKCLDLGVTLVTCDDPVPALNLYRSLGVHP